MRPIAILQHEAAQGPGFLRDYLQHHGLPFRLFNPAQELNGPLHARDFSGIVVLGSNHSVHDELPWIGAELQLLQDALEHDVPVLGHCFGAQLLACAMGAQVRRNACAQIGWSRVWITPAAQASMGQRTQALLFHWHYDSFTLPRGAKRTMYGQYCLNKGFVHGRHCGFQGHLEVTQASVRAWCLEGREELAQAQGPAVQTEAQILHALPERTRELHRIADHAYSAWTQGLTRPCSVPVHSHG